MPQGKQLEKRVGADGTYMYRDVSYSTPKWIREVNPMQDADTSKMMGRDITGGKPNMRDEIQPQMMKQPRIKSSGMRPSAAKKMGGSYSKLMGIKNR